MRRCHRAQAVIRVGIRCAEHKREVAALLTQRQVDDGPVPGGDDLLDPADESIELVGDIRTSRIKPAEPHEDGYGRPQLGEKR